MAPVHGRASIVVVPLRSQMAACRLMERARGARSSFGQTTGCGSISTPTHPRHFSKKNVVESTTPSCAPVSTNTPGPSSGMPSSVKKKVRKSTLSSPRDSGLHGSGAIGVAAYA